MGTEGNSNSPLSLESWDCDQSEFLGFQHDHGALDGAVLRIVNDAANGTENRGESGQGGK